MESRGSRGQVRDVRGCYAKVIGLSKQYEPEIDERTRRLRFGTILENVSIGTGIRRFELDDDSLTDNNRAL